MTIRASVVMPLAERFGGSEVMLEHLAEAARASELELDAVFLADGPMATRFIELGHAALVIDVGRLRQAHRASVGVARLARHLRRARPQVVISWMAKAHYYTAPAAIASGLHDRLVWWQHAHPTARWGDRVLNRLPARAVGCSSDAIAREQSAAYPRRRTFVVHPGVDVDAITEAVAACDPLAVRALWSIPERRRIVVVIGRLQRWKNQHRVVEAIAELRDHDVHLIVVGEDSYALSPGYRAELERVIEATGTRDRVTLVGHLDPVAPVLAAADVLVSAADAEPFGIALLEAMAAGLPVVAVDSAGPSEVVEHERTGILVPSSAPAALAAGLRRVLADPAGGIRMGRAGRDRASARFGSRRMAEGLRRALEDLELVT